jgi:peptidoglycan/LPS O-acetylase OafA/YrhL
MLRGHTRLAALLLVHVVHGSAEDGVTVLSDNDEGGIFDEMSGKCRESLHGYATCEAKSGLYSVCASAELLNSTGMQKILGCSNVDPAVRLKTCQEKCLQSAGLLVNGTLTAPCSPATQAMHGFNEGFNIFTIGMMDKEMNVSKAVFLPFPNVKSMAGPATMQLGWPEKCVEVPSAQYCVLSGQLPLAGGSHMLEDPQHQGDAGPGGSDSRMAFTFALGNCLPKACQEAELQAFLQGLPGNAAERLHLHIQCGFVRTIGNATGASQLTEKFLGWGGVPVEHINYFSATPGFIVTLGLTSVVIVLVALGTALDIRKEDAKKREALMDARAEAAEAMDQPLAAAPAREDRRPSCIEGFLNHWSLVRNCSSFMRLRQGDQNPFACMDAIRVFSMFQVILGHSFLYPIMSSGLSNMEQFAPPNGLMGTSWFQVIPGCFYGVDSFFLLSGFLCAHGLQKKVFSKPQFKTPAGFSLMYLKFALSRYLRLLPLEMFVMLLDMYILPNAGSGVLWNMDRPNGARCADSAGGDPNCGKYWWANVLFIQNLDHFIGKCMGHTWYLAADMQIYLTAPFFGLVYGINRKAGWAFLVAGLAVGIALPVILMAQNQWVPDMLLGGTHGFAQKVYMKPWCRLSPFFIGIALAWLWSERFEKYAKRPAVGWERAGGFALSLLGVGLCCLATFGRLAFYQCDLADCIDIDKNPAGKVFMYLWAGLSIPVWAVGLGIVMILSFQDRFLPLLQPILTQAFWQPLAKLTYAAYLIHTTVLILDFCQRDSQLMYSPSGYLFSVVSFVVISMFLAFCLYMLVEKPLANLQMKVLGGGGD